MKFGEALEAAKAGKRIRRTGWNGKGLWVAYSPGATLMSAERVWGDAIRTWVANRTAMGETAVITPYLVMKTAADELQSGWLASQSDMLAEDWEVVA